MSRKQITEEKQPGAPAYIVTFSDMVTLLLTFFVMLLSLANTQDPELFNRGRDAFVQSIRGMGLGMFTSRRQKADFGQDKIKYFIPENEEVDRERVLDAQQEQKRRSFERLSSVVKTMPSQIVGAEAEFVVTSVRFNPYKAVLDDSSKKYLDNFSTNLLYSAKPGQLKFYVLGLATEAMNDRQNWILSAQRAQTAADYLRQQIPENYEWNVYCWGGGKGGNWAGHIGDIERSQILIAVIRSE